MPNVVECPRTRVFPLARGGFSPNLTRFGIALFACALAYFATGALGPRSSTLAVDVCTWYWLPNSLLLAALLLISTRAWLPLLPLIGVAHAAPWLGSNIFFQGLASSFLCNEGLVVCAATILRPMMQARAASSGWQGLYIASLAPALGSASSFVVGAWLLVASTGSLSVECLSVGTLQTLTAFVTITPAIVCWSRMDLALTGARQVSAAAIAVSLAALICLLAVSYIGPGGLTLLCALPLLVLWVALRFGVTLANSCLLVAMLMLQWRALPVAPAGVDLFLFATGMGALTSFEVMSWHQARAVVVSKRLTETLALLGTARAQLRRRRRRQKQTSRAAAEVAADRLRPSVQALARSNRLAAIGEITAVITHEVNQPLAAILNNVETALYLLERKRDTPELLREILRDIRSDDLRASEVVRRTRALLQDRELARRPVDLNAVVSDAVHLMSDDARRRNVQVTISTARIPLVQADALHLQQVMVNLIGNAFDALERSGGSGKRIEVSTRSRPGYAQVCVTDSGCGIPEGDLERIFDSFLTGRSGGLGLGLSLSRSIVIAHGGRIFAENNMAGPGATIRFELPVSVGPESPWRFAATAPADDDQLRARSPHLRAASPFAPTQAHS
jgi:signal transduction histidine kinase